MFALHSASDPTMTERTKMHKTPFVKHLATIMRHCRGVQPFYQVCKIIEISAVQGINFMKILVLKLEIKTENVSLCK